MASKVIVGLPDAALKQSRDLVSTALINSGFKFPMGRTTINLAPEDVRKEGPSFDLPIALGMLAANDQLVSATSSIGHSIPRTNLRANQNVMSRRMPVGLSDLPGHLLREPVKSDKSQGV